MKYAKTNERGAELIKLLSRGRAVIELTCQVAPVMLIRILRGFCLFFSKNSFQ